MVRLVVKGFHIPLDSEDEDQVSLGGDVGRVLALGNAVKTDLLTLRIAVLLDVLLSTLEDDATLLLVGLRKTVSELSFKLMKTKMCNQAMSDPKEG